MIRNVPPTLAKKVDRPQGAVNPAIPIAPAANREEAARATLPTTRIEMQAEKEEGKTLAAGKIPAAGVNPDAV
ncbi:hypothetical protein ACS73_12630 [Pseudomonas lini]|nr:hypothetical protein ACS73_12630 [Pseudomonas lini]